MLVTILIILLVLWLLGVIGGIGGSLIHVLLIACLVVVILWFVDRRPWD